jgi:hypothetical protein
MITSPSRDPTTLSMPGQAVLTFPGGRAHRQSTVTRCGANKKRHGRTIRAAVEDDVANCRP